MVLLVSAAWAGEIPGAVLRASDRIELGADGMAISPDGAQILLFGPEKATALGPQGDPVATIDVSRATLGDISKSGRFALVHDGGVTLHSDQGREIGRLAAFGKVHDLALSPDGRFLGLATSLTSSVYDAVDGRTLWSKDGEATRMAYDDEGRLYVERGGEIVALDPITGKKAKGGTGEIPVVANFLPDGCLKLADGQFCPSGPGAMGVQRPDGGLWLVNAGVLDRWHAMPEGGAGPFGADGGAAISGLAWMGTTDLLVARVDGQLERRGPDGSVVATVTIPDCSPCDPLAIGADPLTGGFWAVSRSGSWMAWDPSGEPAFGNARPAEVLAVERTAEGRWVSLGLDGKARIGGAPGKGGGTKPLVGAIGMDAAGDSVVVWSESKVMVFGPDRKALPSPEIGVGRKPVKVALSPDGAVVAILDDGGALHAYSTRDGRTVFRAMAQIAGTHLEWAPGSSYIIAGGDPLRVFSAANGKEVLSVKLAPDGAMERLAVATDGTLAVAHTGQTRQLLRRVTWSTVAP